MSVIECVITRIEITLDCLFEAMKKNQVSLRSGGIRGASFVRGALCCLGLCSLFVGSPSVQVAVQLCAVSTTKCRKKNSEFSLLCLSSCEFEFQRILPDSDNCMPETSTQ